MTRAAPTTETEAETAGNGSAAPPAEKRLRADARRNREKVLKAARAVFAEQGREAQMDDVARRARVGVGTVYRHFPTKDVLLEELVREHFREIAAWAEEALKEQDAWEAFTGTLWRGAELHVRDRALAEALADAKSRIADEAAAECGLFDAMTELLERAQRAGALRPDFTQDDLQATFCALGAVMNRTGFESGAWRRHLALMIDGMRAPAASAALPRA
jgi:AcrR family transcriptional regulator